MSIAKIRLVKALDRMAKEYPDVLKTEIELSAQIVRLEDKLRDLYSSRRGRWIANSDRKWCHSCGKFLALEMGGDFCAPCRSYNPVSKM